MQKTALIHCVSLVLLISSVFSEIPRQIAYQGLLTDSNGNTFPDSGYELTFTLYDAESEGAGVWTETHTVSTVQGVFSVFLGSSTTLDLPFDVPYWLGVAVAGKTVGPRMKLASAAYALRADTAGVAEVAKSVDGGVIAEGTVDGGKIRDGSITGADINDSAELTIGKLGIGTTESTAMLDVNGPVKVGAFNTDNEDQLGQLVWLRSGNWDEYLIKGDSLKGVWKRPGFGIHMHSSKHFAFFSTGWDPLLDIEGGTGRIYMKGNVGIGRIPVTDCRLEVGCGGQKDYFRINNDANVGLELISGTAGGVPYIDFRNDDTTDFDMRLQLQGDDQLAIHGGDLVVGGNVIARKYLGENSLVLDDYQIVNPESNVCMVSPGNDRDSWIFLDGADMGSNWGIYHRQIDEPNEVKGLPLNSIGFIGGGSSTLQSYISLQTGNAYFSGNVGVGRFPAPSYRLAVLCGDENDYVRINNDKNVGLELISGTTGGTPFIDFVNDITSDYDMRIILEGDDQLAVHGGDLEVGGEIRANSCCQSSDRRFKKSITPLTTCLNKVSSLQGVSYEWDRASFPERNFPEGRQIGLIAQDVETVVPEVVSTDHDGYKSLAYDKLVAVLIEAVKEQRQRIESLEARIGELEKR